MSKKAVELGYIKDPKEGSLSKDEALEQAGFEAVSWGLNSRGKAERARRFLGWRPQRPSIEDEAESILKDEKRLKAIQRDVWRQHKAVMDEGLDDISEQVRVICGLIYLISSS